MSRPSLTCNTETPEEQAMEWLARLNADDHSIEEANAFKRWLDSAPAHQQAYEEALLLWHDLESACDQYYTDQSLEADIVAAQAAIQPQSPPQPARNRRWYVATFALCCLTVLAVQLPTVHTLLPSDYQTDSAETASYSLPDGSNIKLNSNTRLDISFSESLREVELYSGEAIFNVQPDSARPFLVHTIHGTTRVVGTWFNVDVDENSTRVDVFEGKVRVEADDGQQRQLTARMYQRFNGRFVNDPVDSVTAQQRIKGWQQGLIVIRQQPLTQVIEQLNQQFDGHLMLAASDLDERVVSGVFSLTDRDATIELLRQQLQLQRKDLLNLTLLHR